MAKVTLTKAPGSAPSPAERDPRWMRVIARDRTADGKFFYSVATTGVYCRPSCPSRTANPKNVSFHESAAGAEAAGFRPCKRCKPDEPSSLAVAIPCHRVVRSDGSLAGYRWGIDRKRALIERELEAV